MLYRLALLHLLPLGSNMPEVKVLVQPVVLVVQVGFRPCRNRALGGEVVSIVRVKARRVRNGFVPEERRNVLENVRGKLESIARFVVSMLLFINHDVENSREQVLDLEITNASLVSLNATLEKGKAKQATEIRELRRRIRDQSLHLPFPPLPTSPSPGDQDDESDTEEEDWDQVLDADPPFREIARVMESLIRRGTNAVQAPMHSGTKVLGEGARIGIGLIRQESETSDLAAVGEESFVDSVYASIDGDEEESTMQEDSPGRLLPRYSEQSTASAASEPEVSLHSSCETLSERMM